MAENCLTGTFVTIQTNIIHVMSLKVASGRFFFHFREVFEKCIDYIGKFLVHFREVLKFLEKVWHFRQILDHFIAHFLESP